MGKGKKKKKETWVTNEPVFWNTAHSNRWKQLVQSPLRDQISQPDRYSLQKKLPWRLRVISTLWIRVFLWEMPAFSQRGSRNLTYQCSHNLSSCSASLCQTFIKHYNDFRDAVSSARPQAIRMKSTSWMTPFERTSCEQTLVPPVLITTSTAAILYLETSNVI